MYIVQYCYDPDNLKDGKNLYDVTDGKHLYPDKLANDFEYHWRCLDEFSMLLDYYNIVISCVNDLKEFKCEKKREFWKANKYLLNYVNAIYCYKEYISGKYANRWNKDILAIFDSYYTGANWYRFICDYRNYIVHEATLLRDGRKTDGTPLMALDDMIERLERFHYSDEKLEQKKKEFLNVLQSIKSEVGKRFTNGKSYLPITYIVNETNQVFEKMYHELLWAIYMRRVKNSLIWMIKHIYKKDGKYTYTFIVNNIEGIVYEPNFVLESFLDDIIMIFGTDHKVAMDMAILLKEEGYTYLYDSRSKIDGFINRK